MIVCIRFLRLFRQRHYFVSVGIEDVLLAPGEVGVHLPGQQCILGYICASRVVIKREQE